MEKKISIIVPIYNIQDYIKRCVDSILSQHYDNIEVILVNDGSEDSSLKIIVDNYNNNSRIKIIDKENGGLSSARNAGLNVSTGDYIMFVDGDDWLDSSTLEVINNVLNENADIDIIEYGYAYAYEDRFINAIDLNNNTIMGTERILNEFYYGSQITDIVCNKLFSKKLFKNLAFDEGEIHEDYRLMPKLLSKTKSIRIINNILYYYYQRNDSITGLEFTEKTLERIKAGEYVINYCSKNKGILKQFTNAGRIRLCFICIYLYKKWLKSNRNQQYKTTINDTYAINYKIIRKTSDFKKIPLHKRLFLIAFRLNKYLTVTAYSILRRNSVW